VLALCEGAIAASGAASYGKRGIGSDVRRGLVLSRQYGAVSAAANSSTLTHKCDLNVEYAQLKYLSTTSPGTCPRTN
jgi:hypothetical protein